MILLFFRWSISYILFSISKKVYVPEISKIYPLELDYILMVDHCGNPLRSISILDIIKNKIPLSQRFAQITHHYTEWITIKQIIKSIFHIGKSDSKFDLLHTNALECVDNRGSLFFVSFRHLDTIALINITTKNVVWYWGKGIVEGQHDPTLTKDDQILVFDNKVSKGQSRIIKVKCDDAPRITWEYTDSTFYSRSRGGCQELPNGNILISESSRGRVFEVTLDGEIVWEWYNPYVDNNKRIKDLLYGECEEYLMTDD